MINKRNLLGKTPDGLGLKDAIHTAIVSVRAAAPMMPGARCGLNDNRECVPQKDGVGVVDPFRRRVVLRGDIFWMVLCQDEVPNVRHEWDHTTVDFRAPEVAPGRNEIIAECADQLGVGYDQLMEAAQAVVSSGSVAPYRYTPAPYRGSLSEASLEVAQNRGNYDRYDFWEAWASESLYEFHNGGTDCCPEYAFPECDLFIWQG